MTMPVSDTQVSIFEQAIENTNLNGSGRLLVPPFRSQAR
jgi:hypothetical protein